MAVTNFIAQVWAADILANFHQQVILAPTLHNYSDNTRIGNTIHVTSFTTPTIVNYATGTSGARTIDPQDLTDAGLQIQLNNLKAFGFYVDDVDRAQAAGDMGQVTADAAAALSEDFESAIAAALMANGTASGVTAPSDGETAYKAVLNVRRQLSDLKVPAGNRTLAVNGKFAELLMDADSKLAAYNTSGSPDGLRDATIGQLLGFRVVETALLNPAHASFAAYHESSLGWASQIDNMESLRSPNKFADIVRGLHVYGVKVLRPTAILTYASTT